MYYILDIYNTLLLPFEFNFSLKSFEYKPFGRIVLPALEIEVKGLKRIKEKFEKMPKKFQRALREEFDSLGYLMESYAKAIAPVRTGRLRDSIFHSVEHLVLTIGAKAYYASFVEFGTRFMHAQPYLRPAIRAFSPITHILKPRIREILEE
jgi:HK97 gp10 family phage protein